MSKPVNPATKDLYPDLPQEELAIAEENLERYLTLVLRIFERTEIDGNPQVEPLTANTGTLACTPP